jgi:hypothetical protein
MMRSTAKHKFLQDRIAVLRHRSVPSSRFLSGRFAASFIFSRERRKRLDLFPRLFRMPRTNNTLMLTERSAAGQSAAAMGSLQNILVSQKQATTTQRNTLLHS